MSRFMSPRFAGLEAYTPGEQPQDQQYVKLYSFLTEPSVITVAERMLDSVALTPCIAHMKSEENTISDTAPNIAYIHVEKRVENKFFILAKILIRSPFYPFLRSAKRTLQGLK